MTLAIEPMVAMGDWKVRCLDDDWTMVTTDHSLTAHYENTVLVTKMDRRFFHWSKNNGGLLWKIK